MKHQWAAVGSAAAVAGKVEAAAEKVEATTKKVEETAKKVDETAKKAESATQNSMPGFAPVYLWTNGGTGMNTPASYNTNTWYHVVATVSGTATYIYVNGQQVASGATGRDPLDNAAVAVEPMLRRAISSVG